MTARGLEVRPEPLGSPLARDLLAELDAELDARYADSDDDGHYALDPSEVAPGAGSFVVAWLDGIAVGCGAVRRLDDDRAELKRMYTRPWARGQRVVAAVLAVLEAEARRLGARTLVLETGPRQPEAIRAYTRAGFVPCPCWGEYLTTPDTSRCFRKPLTDRPAPPPPGRTPPSPGRAR